MALNKNHEFEELDGVKCGIVEKNVLEERKNFLKELLEFNGYTVVAVPSPVPKAAAPKPIEGETSEMLNTKQEIPNPTFTVGVTDYTFNWVNAIFGRLLKTKDGHIVTLGYWEQKDKVNDDEMPYFEDKNL